jgi:hypothetical protein
MTPQDWKDIEQALATPYGSARVLADGHELTLAVERSKGLRYVVAIYIDDKIEWGKTVRPEADAIERKFWRSRRHYLHTAKVRAEYAAQAKRRGMPPEIKASYARQAEASFEHLDPTFPSGKAACAHLRRHCSHVERLPTDRLDVLEVTQ